MRIIWQLSSTLVLGALVFIGCSDDKKVGITDAGTDTDTDVDSDTDTDTDTDGDTDSDTDSDTDTDADTDTDTGEVELSLTGVIPEAASRQEDTELLLVGTGFVDGMTVTLYEDATDTTVELGSASVEVDGESGGVWLNADPELPQGYYDVTVTNPDSEADSIQDALYVSVLPSPKVNLVEPPIAWTGTDIDDELSDRLVQIKGEGFINTPWVRWVDVENPDQSYEAVEVHFIDAQTIEAVVPSESASMQPGDYHVWVSNPDNLSGQWIDPDNDEPGIFVITDVPPPDITEIDPVQWPFMDVLDPLMIHGEYFQDGATVAFVEQTGDVVLESVSFVDSTELHAVIPADVLDIGIYPVRVTNPDGQWDIFYAYEAKNGTDGHFDEQTFVVETESPMAVARERLGVDFAFDDFGGTHKYAAGGIDGDGTVRSDVESVSINIYGELGPWRTQVQWQSAAEPREPNLLNTPRQAHNLVRVGDWLFAIGGCDQDTTDALDNTILALNTVEHARVLGLESRPEIDLPTQQVGGTLPFGTWYYRVSALGEWGEGLASRQVQILNASESFEVCWEAVEGATAYNVYRTPAADGRPGTARLLASEVSGPCFVDDGSNHPAPGFVAGNPQTDGGLATGFWIYRMTAVVGDVESVAGYRIEVELGADEGGVVLSWNEVPDATYNVYRTLAAAPETTGNEETYLLATGVTGATWTDDGSATPDNLSVAPDGIKVLPPGTLGNWTELSGLMNAAREGAGAVALVVPSGDEAVDDSTYVYVGGGRPHAGGDGYLTSIERAQLLENGDLGSWTLETYEFNVARAFFPLLTSKNKNETPMSELPPIPKGLSVKGTWDEPIFLFAVAGDDVWSGVQNNGIQTIEAALVTSPDGELEAWNLQIHELPSGRRTYAHDGVIIDDFLFCFPGVDMESIVSEPDPLISNTSRFHIDVLATDLQYIIPSDSTFMAANASFSTPRAYYDTARVNGHVYLVGGNDGSGPIASVESIPQ